MPAVGLSALFLFHLPK